MWFGIFETFESTVSEMKTKLSPFDQNRQRFHYSYFLHQTCHHVLSPERAEKPGDLKGPVSKHLSVRITIPPKPLHALIPTVWFEPLGYVFQLLFASTMS